MPDIEKNVQNSKFSLQLSEPIKIQKSYKKSIPLSETIDSFDLKKNFFDPNKGSPPSNWTFRLLERIEKYGENNQIMFNKDEQMY